MKAGLSIVVGVFALVIVILLFKASGKAKAANQQRQDDLDSILNP